MAMLDTEVYMDTHKKEMVDFIEKKIANNKNKEIKITGEIFDRLANQLTKEMPFGSTVDMTHIVLANALICSLWCGWLSQAMVNKKEEKFSEEYPEKFKRAITKAFDLGKHYSHQRP